MAEHRVPVQSLIDHIKTACDVDPWAKEMAKDMLMKFIPRDPECKIYEFSDDPGKYLKCYACSVCHKDIESTEQLYCSHCGQAVKWNETDYSV